jgi:hypothetical protein
MGYAGVLITCACCGKKKKQQSYHVYKMRAAGKPMACSPKCSQELRHAASRDAKWAKQQARILNKKG